MRVWTVAQICRVSERSERTVRRAIARADRGQAGGLKAQRSATNRRSIQHADLVEWLGYDPLLQPHIHFKPAGQSRHKPSSVATPHLFEM